MEDLISVVIITYKRPITVLERAIRSVINQTYRNIELIVVNDAPQEMELADDIQKMIHSIQDERVHYYQHEKNMGANQARNTGLSIATGKYIAYLDDDDEWLPEKLNEQVKVMQSGSDIALVYCGFYIRSNEGDVYRHIIVPKGDMVEALLESNFVGSTSFPLLLTTAIKEAGGFDVKQRSCQEYELWLRLVRKYRFVGIDKPLGIYYYSLDSTFKGNHKSFAAGDDRIIEKNIDLYKRYSKVFGDHLLDMFLYMLTNKQYKKALEYKFRAWKACFYNKNNLLLVLFLNKKKKQRSLRGNE